MRWRLSTIALATLALLPATARGAVVNAVASDPVDGRPTTSGLPRPDLTGVALSFDDAGTLTMSVDFATDLDAPLDRETQFAWAVSYNLGRAEVEFEDEASCDYDLAGTIDLGAAGNSLSVSGYDGDIDYTPTRTLPPYASGTHIAFSVRHPALAGRRIDCADVSLYAYVRSSAGSRYSRYSSRCRCWYVFETTDYVSNDGRVMGSVWFDGFGPRATPPRPSERAPTRMSASFAATCSGIRGRRWETTPDVVRAAARPWRGRMVFAIAGVERRNRATTRVIRLPVIDGSAPQFRLRAPGRYRLRYHYTGDAWRKPSAPRTTFVRLGC